MCLYLNSGTHGPELATLGKIIRGYMKIPREGPLKKPATDGTFPGSDELQNR